MELKALCDYCGKPAIVHSCRLCGARVCSEHFNAELGLCFKCAARMDRGKLPGRKF
jgi:hypothetical protein